MAFPPGPIRLASRAPATERRERVHPRRRDRGRSDPAPSLVAEAEDSVFVTGPAKPLRSPRPPRLDADVELEEHLGAEQPLHLAPGTRSNLLQPRASLADHDRLLAVALHENVGGDADQPAGARLALGLVEQLDQDRRAVGNLLPGVAQELLADQLGAEIALLQVRPLLHGKHGGRFPQGRAQPLDETLAGVAPSGRRAGNPRPTPPG